jgi:hypothetical protein
MSRRLLEAWYPTPVLRSVRHQVNNLLAPVTVAAEILDDGGDVSGMLRRSTDRIRRVNQRLALLIRPGEPVLDEVALSDLGLPSPGGLPARAVRLDLVRFRERVITELLANDADLGVVIERADLGSGACDVLILRSSATTGELTEAERENLPVPLTMRNGGLGLAIACLETHLQGGRVALGSDPLLVEFLFPLD